MTGTRRTSAIPASTRRLLQAGMLGPALFVSVLFVQDMTRPGFDARRHFVSLLGLGQDGWQQAVSFIVTGLMITGFAVGLRRRWSGGIGSTWAPRLIGVVGGGLVIDGLFATEPQYGYPPGTPEGLPTLITWQGAIHYVAGAAVFASLAAACVIVAVRAASDGRRGFAIASALCPVIMLGAWLLSYFIAAVGGPAEGGLLQRVSIVVGMSWLAILAWRALSMNSLALQRAPGNRNRRAAARVARGGTRTAA